LVGTGGLHDNTKKKREAAKFSLSGGKEGFRSRGWGEKIRHIDGGG